jgi:hypothetical protein
MDRNYLQEYRLSEVIGLIVALSVSKYTFRSNEGLGGSFRSQPKSAKDWLTLAKEHPEFFRMGKTGKTVALLIRFLDNADANNGDDRPPLSSDQTQKLVDQAIALHDKQLARYQRNSFKIPIYCTVVSGIISTGIAVLSLTNNSSLSKKIETLTSKMDSLSMPIKCNSHYLI